MIASLCKEIILQTDYLGSKDLDTIYFGGGTPSMLNSKELNHVFDSLRNGFSIAPNAEITLEANPDDLTLEKLKELKAAGVNRLSIGVQSFNDKFLRLFHRAHNSKQAKESVRNARLVGFKNINVDLIFGIPDQSIDQFENDLEKMIELNTDHISIYGLTIEPNTVFGKWVKNKKLNEPNEDVTAQQLELIMDRLPDAGFSQYEISNFCKNGKKSLHNSNYWAGVNYLGIGPGAHSFNGISRQFNIANNAAYIRSLAKNRVPCEMEILTDTQKMNEFILTKIRTAEGIHFREFAENFKKDFSSIFSQKIEQYRREEMITIAESLTLTKKGKLVADAITEAFFIE